MPVELGTVIVTGGASGLGAATVAAVARSGGTPIVLDRRRPESAHEFWEVDLADTRAAERAVRGVVEAHSDLRGVVTCAGTDLPAPLERLDGATWDRIVTVNLLATAAVVRAALPKLLEQHGRVVTVASTLGHRVAGDATAYCASKFGVVGFTRALTEELKGKVGVTLFTPGGMQTSFFDGRDEQYKPAPGAPLCDPRDVAEAIVFALTAPAGCEVKEMVVAGPLEPSWP